MTFILLFLAYSLVVLFLGIYYGSKEVTPNSVSILSMALPGINFLLLAYIVFKHRRVLLDSVKNSFQTFVKEINK